MLRQVPQSVDILLLGSGWTSTFLAPLLTASKISYATTSTTGHDGTIPFKYVPNSSDLAPYKTLPSAKLILIIFPLVGKGQSAELVASYQKTHHDADVTTTTTTRWIQLGATTIFKAPGWNDEASDYDRTNPRGVAEDEILSVLGQRACVLDLAGLYDDVQRNPKNWVSRVAKTKGDVKGKGAVHLLHGHDLARAVVGCYEKWEGVKGGRWIVCDLRVYDWWDCFMEWGAEGQQEEVEHGPKYQKWVAELMREEGVKALPRGEERLGRKLDGRAFWKAIESWPVMGRAK